MLVDNQINVPLRTLAVVLGKTEQQLKNSLLEKFGPDILSCDVKWESAIAALDYITAKDHEKRWIPLSDRINHLKLFIKQAVTSGELERADHLREELAERAAELKSLTPSPEFLIAFYEQRRPRLVDRINHLGELIRGGSKMWGKGKKRRSMNEYTKWLRDAKEELSERETELHALDLQLTELKSRHN